MQINAWGGAAFAFASTGTYFLGLALFKVAGESMGRLTGTRPLQVIVRMLASRLWWAGTAVMAAGLALQYVALSALPLAAAQPWFIAGLIFLVAVGLGLFGEELSGREWLALTTLGAATLLIAASTTGTDPDAGLLLSVTELAAIAVPSLTLPVLLFSAGDLTPAGQHARPLTGVAYGLSAGILIGTAELTLAVLAGPQGAGGAVLTTPYPYLFVVAVCLGMAQLQIALQRCRYVIVVCVATVIAKTYLLVMALLLDGDLWPDRPAARALILGGVLMTVLAITFVPHHEKTRQPPDESGIQPRNDTSGDHLTPIRDRRSGRWRSRLP